MKMLSHVGRKPILPNVNNKDADQFLHLLGLGIMVY